MLTPDDFRRIALAREGAIESAHMGHPDFRCNGRIFATLYGDGERGMVKLTPDEQLKFMRAKPQAFEPASGAWGRQGSTTVHLAEIDAATVESAMLLAWRATTKPKRSRARTKSSSRSR